MPKYKHSFLLLTVLCASLSFAQCVSVASAKTEHQQRMMAISIPNEKDPYEVQLVGKMLEGKTKIFSREGGKIRVEANFQNKTQYQAFYSVYVSFFDKNGYMIASTGRYEVFPTDPGKTGQFGLETSVPSVYVPTIAYYQMAFYDGPQITGRK